MKSKRYHFDPETLRFGRSHGVRGAGSDDDGRYMCFECGCTWQKEKLKSWWPVSVSLTRHWGFGRHGVEIGSDGISRPIFAQVFSVGPFRIVLGDMKRGQK